MPDKTISVLEYSHPTLKFLLTDFRNEADPDAIVDISSYEFDLLVKRTPLNDGEDVRDSDTSAYIWLESPMDDMAELALGTVTFYLTGSETSLPPGTYTGEIHWWDNGGTDARPTDGWSVSFTVREAYDILP